MEQNYRANGKLLLSGEYFVLDGARALTVPLKKGQTLSVTYTIEKDSPFIQWQAFENNKLWFEADFDKEFKIIHTSDSKIADLLTKLLGILYSFNSSVFEESDRYQFKTNLEFNKDWGFGSSSTLVHLLAKWANLDPMKIHFKVSNGSGYDVAAASQTSPFIYSARNGKVSIKPVQLHANIRSTIYFAYLGKKQISENEVNKYRSKTQPRENILKHISTLTESMISCSDLICFEKILDEHEQFVAEFLNRKKIKQKLFTDYWGSVKSLGAWGGDFVMFTHAGDFEELKLYLEQKGIQTCFAYNDLVLETKS